jgi:hypothetical protein
MKDDRIAELDREELPVEEFMRRCTQPLSEESIQGTRELSEWFLRSYPTAQERFAYIRRACALRPASPLRAERVSRLRPYQLPVLAIDAHGSAGGSAAPSWSSSIEIPSGDLTKAMRPSRGGRLIVTPWSWRRWQVS